MNKTTNKLKNSLQQLDHSNLTSGETSITVDPAC